MSDDIKPQAGVDEETGEEWHVCRYVFKHVASGGHFESWQECEICGATKSDSDGEGGIWDRDD